MNQIEFKQNNIFPQKKRIKFCFSDNTSIEYDYNLIYSINPKIIIVKSTIDEEGKYCIVLPEKIKKEDLVEFLFLYIGNNKHEDNHNYFTNSRNKFISIINNDKNKFESFLEIILFFNNESFNNFIINNIFIPEMKKNKIIDFLLFSYKLLEINRSAGDKQNSAYLNLFNICYDKAGNNEKNIIDNYDKLKYIGGDILKNIIEKIFYNLLSVNCLLNTDDDSDESLNLDGDSNNDNKSIIHNNDIPNKIDEVGEEYVSIDYNKINDSVSSIKKESNHIIKFEDYRKLINIIMDINNIYNIFDLLSIEYINILSKESINELSNCSKKYVFQKKFFFHSIKSNSLIYEECPLDIIVNNKTIYLVIFFQPFEHSINVCIKLKDNKVKSDKLFQHLNDNDYCFKLFTFYTTVQLSKGYNIFNTKKHNSIISLTNNKSMYNIFKSSINSNEINSFNNTINEEYFAIKAEIKLCYIHTALISYLLQDFSNFSNDTHISKLSKQLFILIMSNKYLDKKNENDILNSILLWLNDEVNIKEDISEIFYNINWECVDDSLIFELIVKYSHYISNNESTRLIFYKIFEEKYGKLPLIRKLINNIFSASKRINYERMFSQMKSNDKFNNAYISYNSYLNISNNQFKHVQTLQHNQISSFDKIINKSTNLNNNIRKNTDNKINNKNTNDLNKNNIQKNENSIIVNKDSNLQKNKTSISYTKINKKCIINNEITRKRNGDNFNKNKNSNNNINTKSISFIKNKEDSTLEKMKRIRNKINIRKLSHPKLINKIDYNSNKSSKILKTDINKNSTYDFMKLTLNNSNSTINNFQTLFNKTFNSLNKNTNVNKEKKDKKDKIQSKENIQNVNSKDKKKKVSISLVKKRNYKIKVGKK